MYFCGTQGRARTLRRAELEFLNSNINTIGKPQESLLIRWWNKLSPPELMNCQWHGGGSIERCGYRKVLMSKLRNPSRSLAQWNLIWRGSLWSRLQEVHRSSIASWKLILAPRTTGETHPLPVCYWHNFQVFMQAVDARIRAQTTKYESMWPGSAT